MAVEGVETEQSGGVGVGDLLKQCGANDDGESVLAGTPVHARILNVVAVIGMMSIIFTNYRRSDMKTFASREVQNKFGTVANIVKAGEAVAVTQYGQPTMMILPYAMGEEALRTQSARRFVTFLDSFPPVNSTAPDLTLEQINQLVHELRP